MKITSYLRLPIISFIISFCLLLILLVIKINDQNLIANYMVSTDFMRILGNSLYTMLVVSICFAHIKLYTVNMRNVIFIIITIVFALSLNALLDSSLVDFLASLVDLSQQKGYQIFSFWFPILSRILAMIIILGTVYIMSYCAKHYLNWHEQVCDTEFTIKMQSNKAQISYFIIFYLAVNFIFQRYLYVAVYLYFGGNHLTEYHNISFYLAAIMTAILLLMFIKQEDYANNMIRAKISLKIATWLLLSQLFISILIAFITIYAIQLFFVWTQPTAEADRYTHYISLIYTMVNSIFVVTTLTCLTTYWVGRFWLKKILFNK